MMTEAVTEDQVRELLSAVYDPELGVNIVDLGLVYAIEIEGNNVSVTMTLTTPGCPMHDTISGGARTILEDDPAIGDVNVKVVWEPAWNPAMMSEKARSQLGYV